MAEWLNAAVLKTVVEATPPRVRILPPPNIKDENLKGCGEKFSPRFQGDSERSERQRDRVPMGRPLGRRVLVAPKAVRNPSASANIG